MHLSPSKRGNKYFIFKAFCTRGFRSPSLPLCFIKPRRQPAAYLRTAVRGAKKCSARGGRHLTASAQPLSEPLTRAAACNGWHLTAIVFSYCFHSSTPRCLLTSRPITNEHAAAPWQRNFCGKSWRAALACQPPAPPPPLTPTQRHVTIALFLLNKIIFPCSKT